MTPYLLYSQLKVYKAIVDYLGEHGDPSADSAHPWKQKLSRLLESYPSLAHEEERKEEGEDSQGFPRDLCPDAPEEVDSSLSSSDDEEDKEEEGGWEDGGKKGVAGSVAAPRRSSSRSAAMQKRKVLYRREFLLCSKYGKITLSCL